MYALIDRHPGTLDNAARFVLWAMRGWAQSAAGGICAPKALHRGFTGLGLGAALPDFHIAMALLHRSALHPPRMAPMGCTRIHEDEAVLLSLWQAIAAQDGTVAQGTLALLVRDDAVKPVARAMTACSTQLVLAGFDLSQTTAARVAGEDRGTT